MKKYTCILFCIFHLCKLTIESNTEMRSLSSDKGSDRYISDLSSKQINEYKENLLSQPFTISDFENSQHMYYKSSDNEILSSNENNQANSIVNQDLASVPYELNSHPFGFQWKNNLDLAENIIEETQMNNNEQYADALGSLLQSLKGNSNRIQEIFNFFSILDNDSLDPIYTIQQIQYTPSGYNSSPIRARMIKISNPHKRVSFLTPPNGCGTLETVQNAAKHYGCKVAINAGFFNTKTYACLGPVISNGKIINNSTAVNVAFGITKNGNFSVGYMNQSTIESSQLDQLLSGVIWLVKSGASYVNQALHIEDMSTQTSGTGDRFVSLRASRTAIGHTINGELLLLQADGDGNIPSGLNLHEMASIMIKYGAIQAINLDGGGSSTTVVNGEVISSFSDGCPQEKLNFVRCPRAVSTIVCIHSASPEPQQSFSFVFWYRISIITIFAVAFCITSSILIINSWVNHKFYEDEEVSN